MNKCRYCGKEIAEKELYCCQEHKRRHELMREREKSRATMITALCCLSEVILAFLAIFTKSHKFIGIGLVVLGLIFFFMNGLNVSSYYIRIFGSGREEVSEKEEDLGLVKYVGPILAFIMIICGLTVCIV